MKAQAGGEAQPRRFSLLTLGLVLYIYRAQLKPAGFSGRCQHAMAPPVILTGSSHHTQMPQYSLDEMAYHSFKRTQANPLYLPEI